MRHSRLATLAALTATLAAACTPVRNPATGELQYTSLSPAEERRLGEAEHPKALAQFGGAYDNAKLTAYVERVGARVKDASELKGEPFTFTLLDSEVVNAFALPGGYVYVTRGLVALANDEAELAGVLGHEVGHVTARHSAQRYDRAQIGQGLSMAGQVAGLLLGGYLGGAEGARAGGELGGQAASLGAQAYVQGYSREQEFQADELGIRYLGAAGYDPGAMGSFLATLQANDAYRQRLAGQGADEEGDFLAGWFRTHPRTPERVARATEAARTAMPGAHATDRDALLAAIDGMIYGEDPAQGIVDGSSFRHPGLRIAFEAPPGFRLQNSPSAVAGSDGQGRLMLFDMASDGGAGDLRAYLQQVWVTNQRLQDLRALDLGGQPAAVGFGRVAVGGQPAQAMFAAVRGPGGRVFRLLYAKRGELARADVALFERSLRSFRPLSVAEAAGMQPARIAVVPVRPGDTIESLARQMAVDQDPQGLFVLLNGFDRGRTLRPGDRVKVLRRG